ncbi:MAG: hypothetical protein H6581_16165 [Bacteroidia bacterium]|nr:hypothetical protein [Bacteroidia bacterium]
MKKAGIEEIQKLAGDVWTDFNEHDPGVTILEQLCFTLTELAYKARFKIEDILYAAPKTKEEIEKYPFYKPHEVFPCAPLSDIDYRALIIDSMYPYVENAWLVPVHKSTYGIDMHGLFKISLLLKKGAPIRRIQSSVHRLITRNRNLCEDLQEIEILKPLKISISGEIDINPNSKAEVVAAQVLFEISNILRPNVHFRSMETMVENGVPIDQIFNRPEPVHGFIDLDDLRNSDLNSFRSLPVTSMLMGLIREEKGVEAVRNIEIGMSIGKNWVPKGLHLVKILDDDDRIQGWYITPTIEELSPGHFVVDPNEKIPHDLYPFLEGNLIPEGFYPSLDIAEIMTQGYLKFYANRVVMELDHELVRKNLDMLRVQEIENFEYEIKYPEELPSSKFKARDIEYYFSLQHTFPKIYGIGPYGPPSKSTEIRRAQALQLKCYLLFYEILMASYLSQLTHFHKLLSLDEDTQRTYFSQMPVIPNLHLVVGSEAKREELEAKMKEILLEFDPMRKRKNRALDHLLARFGETFLTESHNLISRKAYPAGQDRFEEDLIQSKISFLKNFIDLGRNRGKGFNFGYPIVLQDEGEPIFSENVSVLKKRVSLLFNIQNYSRKQLCQTFSEDSDISLYKGKRTTKVGAGKEDTGTFLFRAKGVNILSEVLMRGLSRDNYKIAPVGKNFGIFFRVTTEGRLAAIEKEEEIKIYQAGTARDCEQAISKLIQRLRGLNSSSEGFHLIEHILLRPLGPPGYYCYLVEEGRILLESELKSIFGFADYFESQLLAYGQEKRNYKIVNSKKKGFRIDLYDQDGKRFASQEGIETPELAEEVLEQIIKAISELTAEDSRSFVEAAEVPYLSVMGGEGGSKTTLLQAADAGRDIFQEIFRKELIEFGKDPENYKISGNRDRGFKIELLGKGGTKIAFRGGFVLKESAQKTRDEVILSIKGMEAKDAAARFILQEYIPKGAMLEEDFFSNRISVVLPAWPSRFQNDKFQDLFEQVIKLNAPAHTQIKCYWADFEEMKDFEAVYFRWLDAKAGEAKQPELDELSYTMILLLRYFEDSNDELVADQMDEIKESIRWL